MHFLVFFCPLVESFIIFFRQLICRVVTIILLVSHFSDLFSRSFRSRSFLFQKFEDKPCSDNAACGAAYYTPKHFVRGHFIKFDGIRYSVPLRLYLLFLSSNRSLIHLDVCYTEISRLFPSAVFSLPFDDQFKTAREHK